MIRLAHPKIPETVHERFREILDTGQLTGGRFVQLLEQELSQRLSGALVTLMSSGTTAALIAFHSFQKQGARKVLVPDFCYPSVVSSALRLGYEVVLVDVEPERLNINLEQVMGHEKGRHTVLMSVDQFGIPGPNEQLRELASKQDWWWFEDAACALGSHEKSVPCASRADLSILSFHPRKTLTTAEGGAVVSTRSVLHELAGHLRNQGIGGVGAQRQFLDTGYNARLSEFHAAIGLAQLEIFDEILSQRRKLGAHYRKRLKELPQLTVPAGYSDPGANFQSLAVGLPEGVDRTLVVNEMLASGVETTMAGFAIHHQPVFSKLARSGDNLVASYWYQSGLALPIHERMDIEDVNQVVDALTSTLETLHPPRKPEDMQELPGDAK